jgi:L-histidine N-alpha-methyltransferase
MLGPRPPCPRETMRPSSVARRYKLIDAAPHEDSFGKALAEGLAGTPRSIPCRFLYDEFGSKLFEEICELPEYYLTRAEREILRTRAGEIAARFDRAITLAELGSGSAAKTRLLIEAFLARHGRLRYMPVDISRSMLEESSWALLEHYGALEIRAVAAELAAGLDHLRREASRPKLVLWLGSSVGNLGREEAAQFLARVRAAMAPVDALLIGIDLRKPRAVLERAYDDAAGITARFTLNLLERANRELDAHFDVRAFAHRAVYREDEGRVEIRIESLRRQRVAIDALGLEFELARGESIHAEDSFKYSLAEIDALAAAAGLAVAERWLDRAGRFSLNILRPA